MANRVTAAQKLHEKFLMLSRNGAKLVVTIARDPDPVFVVGVEIDEMFTPLAKLLTHEEISGMVPDWKNTDTLRDAFNRASEYDDRRYPDEFGHGEVNPVFTPESIKRMGF